MEIAFCYDARRDSHLPSARDLLNTTNAPRRITARARRARKYPAPNCNCINATVVLSNRMAIVCAARESAQHMWICVSVRCNDAHHVEEAHKCTCDLYVPLVERRAAIDDARGALKSNKPRRIWIPFATTSTVRRTFDGGSIQVCEMWCTWIQARTQDSFPSKWVNI